MKHRRGPVKRTSGGTGYYDANRLSRDRNLLFVSEPTDQKFELGHTTRNTLVRTSRYLANNNGIVKGTVGDIALYSIGSGLMPQAKTQDQEWNAVAEDMFLRWAKNAADFRNMFSLAELTHTWSRAIDIDGDVFVLLTEDENGIPRLQTLGSHRFSLNDPDRRIYDGVAVDRQDRPRAYWLDGERKIDPRDIIHISEPDRFDALRGEPSTAHAINNMFDVREILALEKKGVKLNSAIATVITSNSSDEPGDFFSSGDKQPDGVKLSSGFESITSGGIIPKLGANESVESFNSSRPSPTFDGFLEHFIRDFCIGIKLPFEFVWSPAGVTGTGQRLILQRAQRRFEQRQATIAKALSRIWGWWVSKQINADRLPFNEQWDAIEWQRPRKITVDAGRESKALIEEVKMGLTGYKEDYASRGKDWKKELRQRASEEAFIKELSNEFDIDPGKISQRTPNESSQENDTE